MTLFREVRLALRIAVLALHRTGLPAAEVKAAERVLTRQLEAGMAWRTRADAEVLYDRVEALIREYHAQTRPVTGPRRTRT